MNDIYITFPNNSIDDIYAEYSKPLYWPVRRWEVLMPEIEADEYNAFERLFLELADLGKLDKDFVGQLGIEKTIFDRIVRHLGDKGLLDKKNKNSLTEKGKKASTEGKNVVEEIMLAEQIEKKVLFQDIISGEIIPYFNISEEETKKINEDKNAISLYDFISSENKDNLKIPGAESISKALLYAVKNRNSEENTIGLSENMENIKTETNRIVFRVLSQNEKQEYYIKCNFNVNPLTVTDSELSDIWTVKSPFGEACNQWLTMRLRDEIRKGNRELEKKLCQAAETIRETMSEKVPFSNDLHIKLFDEYPAIANKDKYEVLRSRIIKLELANEQLDYGYHAEEQWYTDISKAMERIAKMHLDRLTWEQKNAVFLWLEDHKNINDFRDQLRQIFAKYHISYEYLEANYIKNPNITPEKMKSLTATNAKTYNKSVYKKDIYVFMLLAAEIGGCRYWRRVIESKPDIYERIGKTDYERNNESHDNDNPNVFNPLEEKDRKAGMKLLHDLVATLFDEEKEE